MKPASTRSSTTPGSARAASRRELSADGFELRFAVNYLAGFLLTRLLLPMLESRKPARIVNVSSAGQQAIDFSDVMLTRGYSGVRAYCQSKLAQILFTFDLAKELAGSGVTVNCLHPATYMDTTMVRLSGAQPISTVEQGGAAILQLVESEALAGGSGLYFSGMQESRANSQAYDENARRTLARAELRACRSRRSLGGPGPIGTRRPSLTLVAKRRSRRLVNGDAIPGTVAPEPPGAADIHRVLIAPHICWRADAMGHTSGVADPALFYRSATNVSMTPMAGRLLWEPTRWIR